MPVELPSRRWLVVLFGTTIFLSALLLFGIQPLLSKAILPWFGGSSAVWTTCMLFFQVVLFSGYAYAHLLVGRLRPGAQAMVHLVVLGLVYGVEVEESHVDVRISLTSPMCPVAEELVHMAEEAVLGVDGVKTAKVQLTFDPPWTPDRISPLIRSSLGL